MQASSRLAIVVLTLCSVAGQIDLVALPVWVGGRIKYYGFAPAEAGLTVTLFLAGVVASSVLFASRFHRMPVRAVAAVGFALAAAFFVISRQPLRVDSATTMAILHIAAGLCVGIALSATHGSFGLTANPHRMMAAAGVVLGLFAVVFMSFVPPLIQSRGIEFLFIVIGSSMGAMAFVAAIAFPSFARAPVSTAAPASPLPRIPRAAWLVTLVVSCMMPNQAMVFSFVERIGVDRGFGVERVNAVLIVLSFVNLLPGLLASVMQRRISPIVVGIGGPLVQCIVALAVCNASTFPLYAVATVSYVAALFFAHPFLFGVLTQLDPSGRVAAGTPAMLMLGSCIGPGLGGALSQVYGYPALGVAAVVVAAVAVAAMLQVRRTLKTRSTPLEAEPVHS